MGIRIGGGDALAPSRHPEQLSRQLSGLLHGLMDTPCQILEIGINKANHDAGMVREQTVKPYEVPAICRQDGAMRGTRNLEDFPIRCAQIGLAGLGSGQDIMA